MSTDDLLEWLKAIIRWVHVFAAIMWIGQTYLFNWFEKNLETDASTRPNVMGSLWMVHGGGFYFVEKQKNPELTPRTLHWFKWESATTWLSGLALIIVTYYMGGLLVEPEQSAHIAGAAGIGVVLVGWVIYDQLVNSPLGKHDLVIAALGWLALVGVSFGLRKVMSSRAAYIHVGFLVGTIMAANVWMRILPAQTRMLAAAKEGKVPDDALKARGPQRSRHNSFMVVPLVFLMISNHYPTISYGNDYSWAILGVVLVVGWTAAKVIRDGGFSGFFGSSEKKAPAAPPT
jgi:uncharacterized membrane protein